MINIEYLEKQAAQIFTLPSSISTKTKLIRNRFPNKKAVEYISEDMDKFHNTFGRTLEQRLHGESMLDKVKYKVNKGRKLLEQFLERGY